MDVRCERCKTEYEFDDARITEAGVTVKCTTCGHVFKVKKKALVVTVPVKPGEEALPPPAPVSAPAAPAAAEKSREWKVRQANGNVFTFKELTTLQKWIVERKVSRDDEISLTGETWKRLGNIAELASFFMVVEEAQKAAQLQALQAQQALVAKAAEPVAGPVAPQPVMPSPQATANPGPTSFSPSTSRADEPAPEPQPSPVASTPPAAPRPNDTPRPQSRPVGSEPRFVATLDASEPVDDLAAAGIKKSGGAGKWVVALLVLGGLGGGGYYAYTQGLLPPLVTSVLRGNAPAVAGLTLVDAGTPAESDAGATAKAETPDAGAVQVAENADVSDAGNSGDVAAEAEPADAGAESDAAATAAIATDAGTTTAASAEEPPAEKPAHAERAPHGNYDYWLAQGDRLRLRERFEPALDAYGKAADLKPDRAEPYAGRGWTLLDLGQKLQAEASFREALRLNPRYAVAVMGLAETYKAMGRKQDAIKYYEKYLDILPNGPEAPVAKSAIQRLKE